MSINYKWIPTTLEVFFSILTNHRRDFKIFNQRVSETQTIYDTETEHGFKNSDTPLVKVRTTLGFLDDEAIGEENEYWIALVYEDE